MVPLGSASPKATAWGGVERGKTMAAAKTVWGIDVGQCALKALKLRGGEGEVQVEAFDLIEHPRMLFRPDADAAQLIRTALEQFLARNNVAGSQVAISVPGRSSFTRFVKLPPVETRKIPDIVRFEAEQQIPFPIEEVIWQWQTFHDPDSPDVEVGLFAMKRADINEALNRFKAVSMEVDIVQMAPLALYNFMVCDKQLAEDGATLLVDVGADKTDLVVADKSRIWTRTIQIGGRNFTEALEKAFKLSFSKAEKLKRTAATNKYARQVFQAMRPVFADLAQEIQRSLGYYTSLHRETRFQRLIGLGNGFRLPGMQKFLEKNLDMQVVRVDSFNRLSPSATTNAPLFTENVLSFATAYGLALQGLRVSPVSTNLLPGEIARKRRWDGKRPWFGAAAAALVLAMVLPLYRAMADRNGFSEGVGKLGQATRVRDEQATLRSKYTKVKGLKGKEVEEIRWCRQLYAYRNFMPELQQVISDAIGQVARDQGLIGTEAGLKTLKETPRLQRRIILVHELKTEYIADVGTAKTAVKAGRGPRIDMMTRETPGKGKKKTTKRKSKTRKKKTRGKKKGATIAKAASTAVRGIRVTLVARTPMAKKTPTGKQGDDPSTLLISPLLDRIRAMAGPTGKTDVLKMREDNWQIIDRGGATRKRSGRGSSARGGAARRPAMGGMGRPGMMDDDIGLPGGGMPRGGGLPRMNPRRGGATRTDHDAGPQDPDPIMPDESMTHDTWFQIEWVFTIEGDGVTPAEEKAKAKKSSTGARKSYFQTP